MKRTLVLVLAAAGLSLAACAYQAPLSGWELEQMSDRQQREATQRPEPDTCQRAAHVSLVGTQGSAIEQSSLPAGARIICHNCAVTLDYRAERLNVELGADGKVANVRCG